MTAAQGRVLQAIKKLIKLRGHSPTFEEIGLECGLSSLATVSKHVAALERQGYISKGGFNSARSIIVLPNPEIYGLLSCAEGHQQIFYRGAKCPLCPFVVRDAREVTLDSGKP
jgi:SOS-response transcriptional repressor LexA